MTLIDTYYQPDAAEFDVDHDAMATRARVASVETLAIPAAQHANFDAVLDACRRRAK